MMADEIDGLSVRRQGGPEADEDISAIGLAVRNSDLNAVDARAIAVLDRDDGDTVLSVDGGCPSGEVRAVLVSGREVGLTGGEGGAPEGEGSLRPRGPWRR